MKERIHLSDHFTFKKILRFTISPILMMLFTSIYGVVDGFFISNYVGSSAFAGVNLIYPIIMIVASLGFMFGAGGSALVSKKLGEGNKDGANKTFSLVTIATFLVGVLMTFVFFFLVKPISKGFALINSTETTETMIDMATLYGQIMIGGISLFVMQGYFHPFFSVNEKSHIGFIFTLASGLTNMLFDFLFIGVFKWSVIGAASASLSGMLISAVGPLLYFRFGKNNLIRLGKPYWNFKDVLKSAANGSSEFVSNVSGSIVTILFNIQLLKYIGEAGVSAYGIIAYVCFIFFAIFIGYSVGVAPIIAYNYGSGNKKELTNVLAKSSLIVIITGISMTLLSIALAYPLSYFFASYDEGLLNLTVRAMRIYSICYLLAGISIFGSSFFTALNNGLISALISVLRTLLFQSGSVLLLPLIMGVDGIWTSIIFAELMSTILTIVFVIILRKKYGYRLSFIKVDADKGSPF